MTDTLTVYELCKHGRLQEHFVYRENCLCPGGREIKLQKYELRYEDLPNEDAVVWVEVTDD